eukprot:357152-Chlamydomonas_euryale.AAC.2
MLRPVVALCPEASPSAAKPPSDASSSAESIACSSPSRVSASFSESFGDASKGGDAPPSTAAVGTDTAPRCASACKAVGPVSSAGGDWPLRVCCCGGGGTVAANGRCGAGAGRGDKGPGDADVGRGSVTAHWFAGATGIRGGAACGNAAAAAATAAAVAAAAARTLEVADSGSTVAGRSAAGATLRGEAGGPGPTVRGRGEPAVSGLMAGGSCPPCVGCCCCCCCRDSAVGGSRGGAGGAGGGGRGGAGGGGGRGGASGMPGGEAASGAGGYGSPQLSAHPWWCGAMGAASLRSPSGPCVAACAASLPSPIGPRGRCSRRCSGDAPPGGSIRPDSSDERRTADTIDDPLMLSMTWKRIDSRSV